MSKRIIRKRKTKTMECTTKTPAEHTRELYDAAAKKASRKICGKMIARTCPFKTADTHAAIYNAFDQNPEDKKMYYDDFLEAYGLHNGHIVKNAFDEYRRVHSFTAGIKDDSRRQMLRDLPVSIAASMGVIRDAIYGLDSNYSECAGFSDKVSAAVKTLLNDIAEGKNILPAGMAKSIQKISKLYKEAISAKETGDVNIATEMSDYKLPPRIIAKEEVDGVVKEIEDLINEKYSKSQDS